MHVDTDDIATLIKMQQVDIEAQKVIKDLEALPERHVILEARAKRKALTDKAEKLEKIRLQTNERIFRIEDEDATLAEKQQKVQLEIDDSQHNYRNVEARTKELNGFAKRRNTLEEELLVLVEEQEKVESLLAQIEQALKVLSSKEENATKIFVAEGGVLKAQKTKLEAEYERLAQSLPEEVLKLYRKTVDRSGGVAIALLHESRCGACRTTISEGRLIDMKREGSLALCPHCLRLLVLV